ncbi:MAG: polysaccharide deacetylase family protein [Candidatus Sumerlaeia bacterium]|nr:polysaccharide deacetylase family protein [Candidatus Sumerlaeia bacterium]
MSSGMRPVADGVRVKKGAQEIAWLLAALLCWLPASGARPAEEGDGGTARRGIPRANVRPTSYVLAAGDRLSLLADRYGMDYDLLLRCNPSLKPSEMEVGEVIVLPLPRRAKLSAGQTAKEIRRGIRGYGRVALTFDAGADVGALDDLLHVLRARRARCTFFVTGQWARRHPEALARIARGGHEVFNHSYTHRSFPELASEQIVEELEKTACAIADAIGRRPLPYFRPPYGDRDRRVLDAAAGAGWQCVYWTLDSLDAVGRPKTPYDIVRRVLQPPRAEIPETFLDGAIVLFHAAKPATAAAMPDILDGLDAMGLRPVTVSALIRPPRRAATVVQETRKSDP